MIVPVRITRGGAANGRDIAMVPVDRIDQWTLDNDGCAAVHFGTSAGVVVDPDDECRPIVVDSAAGLFGLAILAYIDPGVVEPVDGVPAPGPDGGSSGGEDG